MPSVSVVRGLVLSMLVLGAAVARAEGVNEERARQLARVLDIEPQLETVLRAAPPQNVEEGLAHLNAIEQAVIELSRAALAVDATLARLQHEEFQAKNAHDLLQARHDGAVERWNIAAILVGNGVAITGSAMQFGSDRVAQAGDWVTIGGSALAAVFGVIALVKHDVGRLPQAFETNLLAPLLGRPANPASHYADWIWRYLDTPLAGAQGSIREQLIQKWTREHRLPSGHSRADDRKLAILTRPLVATTRVDADALDDRADMLADVRERLAGLSGDLELLWREVRARR
jgi:hypothetical protein